jgi:hypothetical protein
MSEAHALMETTAQPFQVVDGTDRRSHTRIPVAARVRVGRPGGAPKRELSLSDLSVGGMFIDADRPARIGARFSAEIELADGQPVYVPEAEVTYNRERPHGCGFGARFIHLPEGVRERLAAQVAGQRGDEATLSVPPLANDKPTAVGADVEAVDIEIRAAQASETTLEIPRVARRAPQRSWLSEAREQVRAAVRRFPSLWVVLMGLGAAFLLVALVLVAWAELSRAPVVVVGEKESGMSSETHGVLVGDKDPTTLDPPVDPLPLERLDGPKAARNPKTGLDKAPADRRTSKTTPRRARSRASSRNRVAGAAPAAKTPAARGFRVHRFPVGSGTRVLRTLPMTGPHRFVVDVKGLERFEPDGTLPPPVKRVRFGRHEGYGRIVFDLSAPAKNASARIEGGVLSVRLPTSG